MERKVDCRDRSLCIHLSIRPQSSTVHSYPTHSLTSSSSLITRNTHNPHSIEWHHFMIGAGRVCPPFSRLGMCEVRKRCFARPHLKRAMISKIRLDQSIYKSPTFPMIGSVELNLVMKIFRLSPSSYGEYDPAACVELIPGSMMFT